MATSNAVSQAHGKSSAWFTTCNSVLMCPLAKFAATSLERKFKSDTRLLLLTSPTGSWVTPMSLLAMMAEIRTAICTIGPSTSPSFAAGV